MKKQSIKKAIFPVAGFGTRFLPATKAQPKEMLPVVDKPVLQYLVEDAAGAGIEDIIFVTGRGKRTIEDHFDYSFELDKTLVEKNKLELVETVRRVAELARFSYVRQPMPLGDGHAISCASHLLSDEPVLAMFGDTLFDSAESPAAQVIAAYEEYQTPVIALSEVDPESVGSFGVIDGKQISENVFRVNKFVEKPSPAEAPSNLAAVGIYAINSDVFDVLDNMTEGKSGEIRLADAFDIMLERNTPIVGLKLKGEWLDTGTKLGLLKASIGLGLKNPEIKDELREYLRGLNLS